MAVSTKKSGDSATFNRSWKKSKESFYTHWTRGEPKNQIQLAFRQHWTLFSELMKDKCFNKGKRVLEVGCGRGSLSCYFADAGYDCTLLDLSPQAIDIARKIFEQNGLKANFAVGDANALPYKDGSFDVVFSIGLLEHFEDIEKPIKEQVRILDKGGIFIGYVVPKYTENVQKDYVWINEILKGYAEQKERISKDAIFRSDVGSPKYIAAMKKFGLRNIGASGVYPLPMISHSTDFPFSLMPERSELVLVDRFKRILEEKRKKTGKNPWLCEEGYGQAFLVWGFK